MKAKKQTKHYPFLRVQQQRFSLVYQNQSQFNNALLPSEKQFYQWMWHAFKHAYRRADLSLILLDEAEAQAFNRDYRGKDYATNVISFALNEGSDFGIGYDPDDTLCGDLIICPQVVEREAAEQGKTLHQHFAHLVIHGTLHLAGYDHEQDDEAEAMEQLETELMRQLGYPDPYQAA